MAALAGSLSVAVLLFAVASGQVSQKIDDYEDEELSSIGLSSGWKKILGEVDTSFSCNQRIYGYYADVKNRCRVYHVCVPSVHADGTAEMQKFSFFCGENTVFDQSLLTCVHELDVEISCDESEKFYTLNEEFGKIPKKEN